MSQVTDMLAEMQAEYEKEMEKRRKATIKTLTYCGELAVKVAREDHPNNWGDRTGNLRSSIGYVVTDKGTVVGGGRCKAAPVPKGERTEVVGGRKVKVETGGSGQKGASAGNDALQAEKGRKDIELTVVAGMEYAPYVENVHHKDVLATARRTAEEAARRLLKAIFG